MNKGAYIVVVLISISVSISVSVIFNHYINKQWRVADDASILKQISPASKQVESELIETTEILSRRGRIAEIKDGKFIINAPENITIIIDKNTIYATYSPDAKADGLPTKMSELKVGDYIETTAGEDIKGKTEFLAKMVKYVPY